MNMEISRSGLYLIMRQRFRVLPGHEDMGDKLKFELDRLIKSDELLMEMLKREPLVGSEYGYLCGYCDGEETQKEFKHKPDCPFYLAKKHIEEVTDEKRD
jgi:hypothetical protein